MDGPKSPSPNRPLYGDTKAALPMKWYQFVICFLFFAHAALRVVEAIGYFSGSAASTLAKGRVSAQWIYAMYPSLRGLMYGMGVLSLATAVLAIVGRQWMAHFDKRGITALMVLYLIQIASNILYPAGVLAIVGVRPGTLDTVTMVSAISSIVVGIAAVILNGVYFKKRAHLFH